MLVYHLAKDHEIQPVYLKYNSAGARHQEKAIPEIYAILQDQFPSVREPKFIRPWQWQFSKFPREKGNRNLRMCELMGKLGVKKVYMGGYTEGSHFPEDNDPHRLSSLSGIEVWNWERLYPGTGKEAVFKIGWEELGKEILELTWSCQLWWNSPCRLCFSCIERENLFNKFGR